MHSPEKSEDLAVAPVAEPASAPRISFSGDFLNGQILICKETFPVAPCSSKNINTSSTPDFEFLAGDRGEKCSMLTADELFFEGRLLPFWRPRECAAAETLGNNANVLTLKKMGSTRGEDEEKGPKTCVNWFVDEDPSPRPPKCTVLWKELLRLKKQHSAVSVDGDKDGAWKRKKKGLERTRSASVRIKPVLKMPICTTTHGRIF
ncbi:hypothetical protein H6P81_001856 [Aristolochia fimbriata]|uniref:Uncharacterized protein n=1 Tax=Aristolochia fimbriata TaxID=158543 RepID=A0AAV7F8R7_ARIFI|nr:hypothetical protein H6P81_001856 [Aristolochia fimbriata]